MTPKNIRVGFGLLTVSSLVWSLWHNASNAAVADMSGGPPPGRVIVGSVGGHSSLLQEQALLLDPAPMFVPTPWNASSQVGPQDRATSSGAMLAPVPEVLQYTGGSLPSLVGAPDLVPANTVALLAGRGDGGGLFGLGRVDHPLTPLQARKAAWQVMQATDGSLVAEGTVDISDAAWPADQDWAPVEFLVGVEAGGLDRSPWLTTSSGQESVDSAAGKVVARILREKSALAPGFYRIQLGP